MRFINTILMRTAVLPKRFVKKPNHYEFEAAKQHPITQTQGNWYRIWGYWKSPYLMKAKGLWSSRQDQRLRTFLMMQVGPGKSRGPSQYDLLKRPKYRVKYVD
ncbi:hypothetical protein SNEBB_005316 [Seison nebaliae]|nr:hypothetical protein SNEBB_005316 [Seison nebaliae]